MAGYALVADVGPGGAQILMNFKGVKGHKYGQQQEDYFHRYKIYPINGNNTLILNLCNGWRFLSISFTPEGGQTSNGTPALTIRSLKECSSSTQGLRSFFFQGMPSGLRSPCWRGLLPFGRQQSGWVGSPPTWEWLEAFLYSYTSVPSLFLNNQVIKKFLNLCNALVIPYSDPPKSLTLQIDSTQPVFKQQCICWMISGLNNQNRGGQSTCASFWETMPISYKGLIFACLGLALLGFITKIFLSYLLDIVILTVNQLQIWRVLTSFLVDISFLNVIFKLYMLNFSLPIIEKTYSTSFALLEIVVQTLVCNIFFIVVGQIFALFGLISDQNLASYGLIHLVFVFLWRQTARDPEAQTRFCFFPCLMPAKYLPWCFLAFFMLFGMELFTLTSCIAGYLQFMVLKKSIVELPLSFYNKLEACLPESIKQNPGFTSIRAVQVHLRTVCRKTTVEADSRNPFHSNNQADPINDRVEVIGNGVSIGGSSQLQPSQAANYKNHWLKENNDQIKQQQIKQGNIIDLKEQNEQGQSGRKFIDSNNDTMMSDCPFEFKKEEDESQTKL